MGILKAGLKVLCLAVYLVEPMETMMAVTMVVLLEDSTVAKRALMMAA